MHNGNRATVRAEKINLAELAPGMAAAKQVRAKELARNAQATRDAKEKADAEKIADAANRPRRKVTVGGNLASPSEELLDKAITYSVQGDEIALIKLMSSGMVIFLDEGIPVEIAETKLFNGKLKIRPRGQTIELWTVSEAIKDE